MEPVELPDEAAFRAFRAQCEAEQGWQCRYSREGVAVWGQLPPPGTCAVHRVKCRVEMPGVTAATVYDVLHDADYRRKWDSNVIETYDIACITNNADVGYYSWASGITFQNKSQKAYHLFELPQRIQDITVLTGKCPKPLKNRDVVTLRSWYVLDKSYVIVNFSVKHPKYPPRKDLVRAVSLQAGYLVQPTGNNSCTLTYLAQVDPKGSLPKWVVNKSSQYLAPKMLKKMHKACLKYPSWKQEHNTNLKPWLHPEQSQLPTMALSELTLQHASSLENIDESGLMEVREERGDTSGSEN